MTPEELARQEVDQLGARFREKLSRDGWWHSIDLGGTITPGVNSLEALRAYWAQMGLARDLSGRRVLDIGCWDGFFSFEAERCGAEVMAVDCWRPPNFFKARDALHSKVEFREMSVYDIRRRDLGGFNVVLFLGVLYHLRHPLLGLERVCEVCDEQAVIESHIIDDYFAVERPLMEFYEGTELAGQYDNWWGPNIDCLLRMTRSAGFVRTEPIRQSPARVSFRAFRQWETTPLEAEPSIHISAAFNPVTWTPDIAASGRTAFLGVYAKGLSGGASERTVRIHLGSVGVLPIYVGDSEYEGHKQVNAAVPPGLDPGEFMFWIEEGGKRSNEAPLRIVEGTEW